MSEDIPGFERDEELEQHLDEDIFSLDEDTRIKLQRYKSQLLKARRDADMSTSSPPWEDVGPVSGDSGGAEETPSDSDEESEPEADDTSSDEDSSAETGDVEIPPELKDAPGFEPDPELEALLEKDIMEIEEDKRVEVQKYKSQRTRALSKVSDEGDGESQDTSTEEPAEASDSDGETEAGEASSKSDEESSETGEDTSLDPSDVDFDEDPEMEELLEKDIMELDEETRVEVQLYKSKKMQAREAAREDQSTGDGGTSSGGTSGDGEAGGADSSSKQAPPPSQDNVHKGERKIKELVGDRESGREVSRRGFLSSFSLGVAGTLAAFGTGAIASARFFFPNVLSDPPEQFVAGDPTEYPTNSVSDAYKSAYRVWIVNLGDRIVAILAICTHLGCTPNWLDSQGIFKCPCHGSGYYMTGVNFEGPAPRPMARVGIRLNPEGKIVVDKSQVFQQGSSPGWDAKGAYIPA
ncbi:MAG: Rieske 2Fe-2S domain-containing protein [bacterium]